MIFLALKKGYNFCDINDNKIMEYLFALKYFIHIYINCIKKLSLDEKIQIIKFDEHLREKIGIIYDQIISYIITEVKFIDFTLETV